MVKEPPIVNFHFLRRSRKPQQEGDVFAMLMPDDLYLFGRVIRAYAPAGTCPVIEDHLLYVYAHRSHSSDPSPSALSPHDLLVPPLYTNRQGWTRGYFETVANWPLRPGDLLSQHCFWDIAKQQYVDQYGRRIPWRVEPCGEFALIGYRGMDDLVSDALGIPRVLCARSLGHVRY